MRAVEVIREEISRLGLQAKLPIETRRMLVNRAKDARKHGRNAKGEIVKLIRTIAKFRRLTTN